MKIRVIHKVEFRKPYIVQIKEGSWNYVSAHKSLDAAKKYITDYYYDNEKVVFEVERDL